MRNMLILILLISLCLIAQTFTEIDAGLTGVYSSSVDWGDYDADGDLDILITGYTGSERISEIYRNDSGVFTDINAGLGVIVSRTSSWGDYDNDGDLDILLAESVYRNDSGTFVCVEESSYSDDVTAWGDYDNDGDLDFISSYRNDSVIHRNDSGLFTSIYNIGLRGADDGSVAWGDYDNDGDLDIILTGMNSTNDVVSKIYRNDSGYFTDIGASLTGVEDSSVDWADFDNDGDLDILLSGTYSYSSGRSIIYRNDSGVFTDIDAGLKGVKNSSVAWGDYDNDGDLDILLTGTALSYVETTRIYRNDSGTFTEISAGLTNVKYGSVAWGDYDNDGDLDILLTGMNSLDEVVSKVYRNNSSTSNTDPSPPTGLDVDINVSSVTLSWNNATDNETPQNGLSYNSYIVAPDSSYIVSPMGNIANGNRNIVKLGNTNQNTSWTINDLYPGSYYWSVQSIDHSFAGSEFAVEQSFTIPFTSPETPTAYEATDVRSGSFTANWAEPGYLLSGYLIDVATDSLFIDIVDGYQNFDVGDALNTDITGLLPDSNYYYRVKAYTPYEIAMNSNIVKVRTLPLLPPELLEPTGITGSGFQANWTPYEGADLYWVDLAKDSLFTDFHFQDLSVGNTDHYFFGILQPATDYYFRIRSVTLGGITSAYSDSIKVRTEDVGHTFTQITSFSQAECDWGDYDNDGDLDVLSGNDLYRNDSGSFTQISSVIPYGSNSHWGDFDNDGDLDILSHNRLYKNNGNSTFSYYTEFDFYTQCGYDVGSRFCLTDFVDVNSDGFVDIFLTGEYYFEPDPLDPGFTIPGSITYIYYNNGNGGFKKSDSKEFSGGMYQNFTWGDYDNDGDPDLLATGSKWGYGKWDLDFEASTNLYRNNISNFTSVSHSFPSILDGSADWGDYDNDGFSDLILSGDTSSGNILAVYKNNQDGTFSDINAGLEGISDSSTEWGDLDNDGYLDVVVKGQNATKIYRNEEGVFLLFTDDISSSSVKGCSWGDYDNDGDLDLINGSLLYNNFVDSAKVCKSANTPPMSPSGLISNVNVSDVTLSWDKASDIETPQDGLSYNVYISTESLSENILSPMSNVENGYRRIVEEGNSGGSLSKSLNMLPSGTYYWSVQAIDKGYQGSEFSPEQTFVIDVQVPEDPVASTAYNITHKSFTANWLRSDNATGYILDVAEDSLFVNLVNGYQDLDVGDEISKSVTGLSDQTMYYYRVKAYNLEHESGFSNVISVQTALGEFSEINSGLPVVVSGKTEWGDYDNDGDLDLFIYGNSVIKLYRNDAGTFIEVNPGFEAGDCCSAAWGDYDSDGDLDIVLCYYQSPGDYSKIYRNDGGYFSDINAELDGAFNYSVEWGDYDNDGDQDLLLAKIENNDSYIYVYKNESGVFSETYTGAGGDLDWGTGYASLVSTAFWIDYDSDGDLDINVKGGFDDDGNSYGVYVLYENSSASYTIDRSFSGRDLTWGDYDSNGYIDALTTGDYWSFGTPWSRNYDTNLYSNNNGTYQGVDHGMVNLSGSSVWGDMDNNGDIDVLLYGYNSDEAGGNEACYTKYYRNYSGSFSDRANDFDQIKSGSITLADYDNDNDLDLLLIGKGIDFDNFTRTKLYRNNISIPNMLPSSPSSLTASINADNITFFWNQATDIETPQNGLSYNLYIGSEPGSCDIMSPLSDLTTGYRKVVDVGNVGQNTSWTINGLPDGTYYWSVQAIDHCYSGSEFAPEQTLVVTSIEDDTLPLTTELYQNYPNPFNPETSIKYSLSTDANVELKVFDITGREVADLINTKQNAGYHKVNFNAEMLTSGMYMYQLKVDGKVVDSKKMMMLK